MRKLLIWTGFAIIGSTPVIGLRACSGKVPDKISNTERDLNTIIAWFSVPKAQQLNHEEIDPFLTNQWHSVNAHFASSFNQVGLPTLEFGSEVTAQITATKEIGKHVMFNVRFKAINSNNEVSTRDVKFRSANIYQGPSEIDKEIEDVKNAIGVPTNVQSRPYKELDAFETESQQYVPFNTDVINKLGISVNYPVELNGVTIKCKLVSVYRSVGQFVQYELIKVFEKGGKTLTTNTLITSNDRLVLSDIELERERIRSLLINNAVETNIAGAKSTKPSVVSIHPANKPFNDNGIPTSGVNLSFTKVSHNDINGTVNIRVDFSKDGETVSLEITLTGFLSKAAEDVSAIKQTLGTPTNLESRTIAQLDVITSKTAQNPISFDNAAISELGIGGITIPSNLNGTTLTYSLINTSYNIGSKAEYVLTIFISKGGASEVIVANLRSTNVVPQLSVIIEKNRISALLTSGAIATNIANADKTLPANVTLSSPGQKPFNDPGTPTAGVTTTFRIVSSNNTEGKLVVEATFSKADEGNQTLNITLTGFMSSDESTVKEIIGLLGTPTDLDKCTIDELNLLVSGTYNPRIFNEIERQKLKINISIPSNLNGVELRYKVVNIFSAPGSKATYLLTITATKGNYSQTISANMQSSDFEIYGVIAEKNRILNLLTGGKIATNIQNASSTLPSAVNILSNVKPFDDPGTPTPNVTASYVKKSHNDVSGEMTISITLSKTGETSETFDIILTGFLVWVATDEGRVKEVEASLFPITNLNTRTYAQLRSLANVNYRVFDQSVINNLGITTTLPTELHGVLVEYSMQFKDAVVNSKATYQLNIKMSKNAYVEVRSVEMKSTDNVVSDATIEKLRIEGLMSFNSIKSSYPDAANTFATDHLTWFNNNRNVKPYLDAGPQTPNTTLTYTAISQDDASGLFRIKVTITDADLNTEQVEFDVFGFLTNYAACGKMFDEFADYFGGEITSTYSKAYLTNQQNKVISSSSGISTLGLHSGNGSQPRGTYANYIYIMYGQANAYQGATFTVRIDITRGVAKLEFYFLVKSSDYQP